MPERLSLTSGAPAYNIFHVAFGFLGLLVLASKKERWVSLFNGGFGLIDLYQALASFMNLPPKQHFLWTGVDDILHLVIGTVLLVIGSYGLLKQRKVK